MGFEPTVWVSLIRFPHHKGDLAVNVIIAFKTNLPFLTEQEKSVQLCVSLPVRLLQRYAQAMHLRAGNRDQIPETHLRTHARPYRHPH